ncbi:MAG: hypothetical protein IPP32_02405 [Bacteroidetes bacterium]|nr:hypothetical protein [Bacteroidota bacterium]
MRVAKLILKITALLFLILFCIRMFYSMAVKNSSGSLKTAHFLIEYKGVFRNNALAIATGLEQNYNRIRLELKDPEHPTIRVFVHGNQADFNLKTGLNNSANGVSRGPFEFHVLWTNWFNSIFPDNPVQTAVHEFTHCVQLNILIQQALAKNTEQSDYAFSKTFEKNFADNYPQWFWEAISIYEAGEINRIEVKYAMLHHTSLSMLSNSNQIYRIGYTIIEYIVATWGKEKLPELIQSYCNSEKVLKVSPAVFEKGWKNYLATHY